MSVFNKATNSLKNSFNLNHIKKVKAQQLELLNLINEKQNLINIIINQLSVIDQQYSTIIQQNNTIIQQINEKSEKQKHLIELLKNKDSNFQNLYAKQHGYKSGFYYKTALNIEINKNKDEIKKREDEILEYKQKLRKNQKEKVIKQQELEATKTELAIFNEKLKICEEALHFYKYTRILLIFSNLSTILNGICYTFTSITNLSFLTKVIVSSLTVAANFIISFLLYINEKKIRVSLSLEKTRYFYFCYPFVCCLCIYFTLFNKTVFNWISTVFLFVAACFVLYNIYSIVKFAEVDNDFNLAIDYIIFNSPIIHFVILYLLYMFKMPDYNNYFSLSFLALITFIYIFGFLWIIKTKKHNQKANFKYALGLCINIIIVLLLLSLFFINIYSKIQISQSTSFWITISLTILMQFINPILNNILKCNIEDPLENEKKNK